MDQWFTHLFSSIHLLVLILTPTTPTPNFPRHAKLQKNIDTDFSLKFIQTQNQYFWFQHYPPNPQMQSYKWDVDTDFTLKFDFAQNRLSFILWTQPQQYPVVMQYLVGLHRPLLLKLLLLLLRWALRGRTGHWQGPQLQQIKLLHITSSFWIPWFHQYSLNTTFPEFRCRVDPKKLKGH